LPPTPCEDGDVVDGDVAPGFEPVRDELARVLESQGGGLAMAAFVGGRPVVDLWGGTVGEDTLVHTWSAIKPVTGACLLTLVGRGAVSLDDPVADVWPELAAGRDGKLRIRHFLTHSAGLSAVPGGDARGLTHWDDTVRALAEQEPEWVPGTDVGEHAQTFGHLVGEVVRRVDGRTPGRFLAEELAGPLDLDVHIGLTDDDLGRAAETAGLTPVWWAQVRGEPGTVRHRALGDGIDGDVVNGETWRRAEIPAVNGHATARGLARFWQAYLDGELPSAIGEPGASGDDLVMNEPVVWSLAGCHTDDVEVGMGGLGGQWAGCRPGLDLAWAFLTTVMGDHQRVLDLEDALLPCVEARHG
jgi:CubicO group peptidase (beta-lactamase class C family)